MNRLDWEQAREERKYWRQEKRRRRRERRERRLKKYKGRNYHHIVNKCRGGSATVDNLLLMWVERHNAWHTLLKNDDWDDAIPKLEKLVKVLKRAQRAKKAQANNPQNKGESK